MLTYPDINPIALQLGPVAIHWYGLAYVVALLGGLMMVKRLAALFPARNLTPQRIEDFFLYAALGVVLGGRLGYVLFYNPGAYLADPGLILRVWEGGMSFHGGAAGVMLAVALFARKHGINMLELGDRVAPAVPLGCLLGRLANFVNGELVGRPAPEGLPWGMVFPHIDALARHPSQLYQAALEGVAVGLLMWLAVRWWAKHGTPVGFVAGVWMVGYGIARIVGEVFRTPEITYLSGLITQGMLLSLPLALAGCWLMWRSRRA